LFETRPGLRPSGAFDNNLGEKMKRFINAVYGDELDKLLLNLNEFERVKQGKAKCKYCSQIITKENIVLLFPESGDVKYVCSSPDCMSKIETLSR
jgi:hypothetical protein